MNSDQPPTDQPADLPRYGPFRAIITGHEHILVGYGLLSDEQVRERGGCHLPGCECPVALEQKAEEAQHE